MAKKNVELSEMDNEKIASSISAIKTIYDNNSFETLRNSLAHVSDHYNDSLSLLTKSIIESTSFDYSKLIPAVSSFDIFNTDRVTKLETTIADKEEKIKTLVQDLKSREYEYTELEKKIKEIQDTTYELQKSKELVFLTCKVHVKAANILLEENSDLLKKFLDNESKKSSVISIDIWRSTDLMLKASSHDNYAKFISGLSEKLKNIVINNFGVFDKFTGDGILAYFPDFYSGEDSILKCIKTAKECHMAFDEYYKENRNLFNVVIKTGLGIGIDYGDTKLVRINNDQTIVGTPVVYACRLSNAPYGRTYINQKAYDDVKLKNIDIDLNETEIDLKNEGIGIVYELTSIKDIKIEKPYWS